MSPERLAEIEGRAKAATLGPWLYADADGLWPHVRTVRRTAKHTNDFEVVFAVDGNRESFDPPEPHDGRFIAAARQDIPDLIAYVRQLEARNADLESRFLTMGVDARRRV